MLFKFLAHRNRLKLLSSTGNMCKTGSETSTGGGLLQFSENNKTHRKYVYSRFSIASICISHQQKGSNRRTNRPNKDYGTQFIEGWPVTSPQASSIRCKKNKWRQHTPPKRCNYNHGLLSPDV